MDSRLDNVAVVVKRYRNATSALRPFIPSISDIILRRPERRSGPKADLRRASLRIVVHDLIAIWSRARGAQPDNWVDGDIDLHQG